MRLYAGNRITEIEMTVRDADSYKPDWSTDFFMAGSLQYDEDLDAYEVDDIDECIEAAEDWENGIGEYNENYKDEDRRVWVWEIDFPPKTRDGRYVSVGTWITNGNGIYEVWDIGTHIELKELVFSDDDPDDYKTGDTVMLNRDEIKHFVCY